LPNEARVDTIDDITFEARRMDALGAGITGGDPAVRLGRTLEYITFLKNEFGEDFHIHMYTATALGAKDLEDLKGAGLDEIRFHVMDDGPIWDSIGKAVGIGLDTGIEIPAVPGEEDMIIAMAHRLRDLGGSFINMNELEFSDTNAQDIQDKGYELASETSYGVKGSKETALAVMAELSGLDMCIHFCSSSFKDSVQLKNRLLRTARNTARGYEEVTDEGLFLKGVIEMGSPAPGALETLRTNLIRSFDIPPDLIYVDLEKMRVETSIDVAETLSRVYKKKGLRYLLVEEYPSSDRLETQVVPL
jgi:pyruvate formate-lyase activating enzyme-like uncharacterized protein